MCTLIKVHDKKLCIMTAKEFFKEKYGDDYVSCFNDTDMVQFAEEYLERIINDRDLIMFLR